jgi:hypothetical protein
VRADLLQVVLEDRDPTRIAIDPQTPDDHGCRYLGILGEHRGNRVFERIEDRALKSPVVSWRLRSRE